MRQAIVEPLRRGYIRRREGIDQANRMANMQCPQRGRRQHISRRDARKLWMDRREISTEHIALQQLEIALSERQSQRIQQSPLHQRPAIGRQQQIDPPLRPPGLAGRVASPPQSERRIRPGRTIGLRRHLRTSD